MLLVTLKKFLNLNANTFILQSRQYQLWRSHFNADMISIDATNSGKTSRLGILILDIIPPLPQPNYRTLASHNLQSPLRKKHLDQKSSRCDDTPSNISITWELIRNANSPKTYWVRNSGGWTWVSTRLPSDSDTCRALQITDLDELQLSCQFKKF